MGGFESNLGDLKGNNLVTGERSVADLVIPVLSEEFSVTKKQFVTGIVRIKKVVHEREESVDEPVIQTKFDIERVPMNRVVEGQLPVRQDGETVIYSVVEEVLVVTKQFVLKEEVRVTKRVSEAASPQKIMLRTEEVVIDREQIAKTSNILASEANMPTSQEGTIELKETTEEALVSKRVRVVEEVSIGKEVVERQETVNNTVRRMDVRVEELGGDHFRAHFDANYAQSGKSYDLYAPAYQYGQALASDPRFVQSDWNKVESAAKNGWSNQSSAGWEDMKAAVRQGWDKVRGTVKGVA